MAPASPFSQGWGLPFHSWVCGGPRQNVPLLWGAHSKEEGEKRGWLWRLSSWSCPHQASESVLCGAGVVTDDRWGDYGGSWLEVPFLVLRCWVHEWRSWALSHFSKADTICVIDHMTLCTIKYSHFVLCGTLGGRGNHSRVKRFLSNWSFVLSRDTIF